jgi:uncharacterized membrane protein
MGRLGTRRFALTRVLIAFAVGTVALAVAATFIRWQFAALIGWDFAAVAYLVLVWAIVVGKDGRETSELASVEDDSRFAADATLLSATIASLFVVGLVFVQASGEAHASKVVVGTGALVSLLLSWGVIHTVFMLRYTHLYYRERGGLDFNDQREPDYLDFAYVAFTVGMTYQVSDTNITSKAIRMSALRHAVLSFVFGTGVLATTVNLVGSLYK